MLLHLSLVFGGIVFLWLGAPGEAGLEGKDSASRIYQVRAVNLAPALSSAVEEPIEVRAPSEDSAPEHRGTAEPPQLDLSKEPAPNSHHADQTGLDPEAAADSPNLPKVKDLRPTYPKARPAGSTKAPSSKQSEERATSNSRNLGRRPAPLWSEESVAESGEQTSAEDDLPASGLQIEGAPQVSPEKERVSGPTVPSRPLFLPPVALPDRYQDFRSASLQVEFVIEADGRFQVRILQGTGIEDLDREIEQTLQKAKWSPRKVAGVSVSDRRVVDIDIER